MDQKTKEELIKLAKSGPRYKTYKQALGFNDCEKFFDAFHLKINVGKNIPTWVVYRLYYNWVKESNKKPLDFSVFVRRMTKYVKSKPQFNVTNLHPFKRYRVYKIDGFPEFTREEFIEAKQIVYEQKEKKSRRKQKILQSKSKS